MSERDTEFIAGVMQLQIIRKYKISTLFYKNKFYKAANNAPKTVAGVAQRVRFAYGAA